MAPANGAPFTCDLSGGDFWALVRAGLSPDRLLVRRVRLSRRAPDARPVVLAVERNVEMPQFTQGLYDARELAMGRMQYDALTAGATAGLVGVRSTRATTAGTST